MFSSANNSMRFKLSRLRWRSSVIVPVAVLVAVAGIAAMFVAPQPESAAASPSIPSVTWSRAVFNAGGHDSCEYVATVHAEAGTQTEAVERTAAELGLTKVETTSEGIEIRSDPYDCTNENADSGDVSPEPTEGSPEPTDVDPVSFTAHAPFGPFAAAAPFGPPVATTVDYAALVPVDYAALVPVDYAALVPGGYAAAISMGKWIVGAVVGTVVGAALAIYGAPVIVAAAAAVGVTITAETASVAAVCLGVGTGAAIGEIIRGGDAQKIVLSAILGCAGGGFIAKFQNQAQAESVVADAIESDLAAAGESATSSAAVSVSSEAESIPSLASDARAVSQSEPHLSSSVGQQLRRSASI